MYGEIEEVEITAKKISLDENQYYAAFKHWKKNSVKLCSFQAKVGKVTIYPLKS